MYDKTAQGRRNGVSLSVAELGFPQTTQPDFPSDDVSRVYMLARAAPRQLAWVEFTAVMTGAMGGGGTGGGLSTPAM